MPLIPVLLLVVAATCAASLPFLWRQREVPGAVGLLALFAAVAWWNAGYALEIATGGLGAKLFWAKAQYPGIVVAPLAVFVFALGYTGRWEWLTARRLAALLVVPAGTIALAWTHELHHLVWSDVGMPVAAGQPLLLQHGIGFFPGWLFAYAMLFSATVMLFAGRWSLRRYVRRQSVVIAISVLTPWLCNAIYVLGLTPDGLDMTTVGFAVTAMGFALARSRWGLLEISPVARDAVVEHLRDGMVVVDNRGRIVDCNRAAAPLLACPFDDAVGRAAADVLPPGVARAAAPHIVEVMLADGPRAYEVEAVDLPLSAAASGRLILLHDVTAREQLHALLRADALTDELTRVGNRRFFLERLQRALEQTGGSDRPVGVVFLDLDDFKAVNDSFGHDVGDRCWWRSPARRVLRAAPGRRGAARRRRVHRAAARRGGSRDRGGGRRPDRRGRAPPDQRRRRARHRDGERRAAPRHRPGRHARVGAPRRGPSDVRHEGAPRAVSGRR